MLRILRQMRGQLLRYNCHWHKLLIFLVFAIEGTGQSTIQVTDESNLPLIGVNITHNLLHYSTDINGACEITLVPNKTIELSYIGYLDKSVSYAVTTDLDFTISMTPNNLLLEEVVVIGRTEAREIDLPYQVNRIKASEIHSSHAQTSADALELNGGAYIQRSQMGGGSPILRGFEANKVLLVVDGVRLNNAIYRNGHLQNAITIDPSILEQVEVIYGPGSLLYGSEALGGVVHYKSKSPLLNFDSDRKYKQSGSAYIRYNSSNNERRIHADYRIAKKKFGSLTSITFADYGDLKMGSRRDDRYPDFGLRKVYVVPGPDGDEVITNPDPNVQVGTAYSQMDILQKWIYKFSDNIKSEFNIQYSNSSDVPRYDNLAEFRNGQLRYAEWFYGPQKRLLISPKVTYKANNQIFDKLTFIGSFQKIEESRISRNLNEVNQENQIENLNIWGMTIDFNKRLSHSQKLVYGTDLHYNRVSSTAHSIDITNNERSNILTRYPSGGSQLLNAGLFVQHNWQNQDSSLVWINGLRWTTQEVNMNYLESDPFQWPDFFFDGIESKNSAAVFISGVNYSKNNWVIKASTGTAFRSPNVDDLAKVRVNRDEITIPNPTLSSEKVWNNELTIGYKHRKITAGITGFITTLQDAIIRTDFTLPDGSTSFVSGKDTLQVTGNVNANGGHIRGLSLQLNYQPNKQWLMKNTINLQKGTSNTIDGNSQPLGHIPPTYGGNSLTYQSQLWSLSGIIRYNMSKPLSEFGGSVDNPDLATIDGSPGWVTYNLAGSFKPYKGWTASITINNITDIHYRLFASGLSAAGRHLSVSIQYKW